MPIDTSLVTLADCASIRQGASRFGRVIGKQVESLRGPATVAGESAPLRRSKGAATREAPQGASRGRSGGEALTREPGNLP